MENRPVFLLCSGEIKHTHLVRWLGSTKARVEILASHARTKSFLLEITRIGVKYGQSWEVRALSARRKVRAHTGEERELSGCLGKPWSRTGGTFLQL